MRLHSKIAAIALIASLTGFSANVSFAQSTNSTQQTQAQNEELNQKLATVDQMVIQRMQMLNMPGYCLAIIKNGKLVFQNSWWMEMHSMNKTLPCLAMEK